MSTQCSVKAMGDVVSDSSSSVLDLAVPQRWLFSETQIKSCVLKCTTCCGDSQDAGCEYAPRDRHAPGDMKAPCEYKSAVSYKR